MPRARAGEGRLASRFAYRFVLVLLLLLPAASPTLRADATATSLPDTLRAAPDTTLPGFHAGHGWWRSRAETERPLFLPRADLSGLALQESPEGNLREILEWLAPLRRMPSGSYQTPDPIGPGDLPGREEPALLLEGSPMGQAGFPETPPDGVGALWLSRLVVRTADPLLLPANPTGGPVIEMELQPPDSAHPTSGARLTSGTTGVYTEEFFLARPLSFGLVRVFYHDHKTTGRQLFDPEFGQNLLVRFDRGQSWGGWRLSWHQEKAAVREIGERRLVWGPTLVDAGADWKAAGWTGDLGLQWSESRMAWETAASAVRTENQVRALLRLSGTGGRFRPLASFQFDRQKQRFHQPDVLALSRWWNGLSLAVGGEGVTEGWHLRGSAGLASPAPERSGWTAALDAQRPAGGWTFRAHGDRLVREPVLPRLANELGVYVGQGLTVPLVDTQRPLESVLRAEFGLSSAPADSAARSRGIPAEAGPTGREAGRSSGKQGTGSHGRGPECGFLLRGVEIRHTVSGEGGLLQYFNPNVYPDWLDYLPPETLDRTVRVASLTANLGTPLLYGFRFGAWATGRVAAPGLDGWKDQLWMTPWDVRARLSWRHRFFQDDLDLEGFVRALLSGERASPYGIVPAEGRFDGGVTARVGGLTLFLLLQNLPDDYLEAAAYDGGWAYLPFRSYRIGLVWRFKD